MFSAKKRQQRLVKRIRRERLNGQGLGICYAMSTKRSKAAPSSDVAKLYEPTPREREAMEAYLAQRKERMPTPRVKVSEKKGVAGIEVDHPEPVVGGVLLMEALGTAEPDFLDGLLGQLANAGTQGRAVDERGLNFMLAMVKGVKPKDQVEAMLAAQMAAVHIATMTFARRLNHVETLPQQDSAERAFNKLARTFAAQVEALKRYRTGGEQKVTVEHVHVHEGGRAIVGTVNQGGRGTSKTRDQGHAKAITHAPGTTLRSADPKADAVPVAGGERPEAVPHARRR